MSEPTQKDDTSNQNHTMTGPCLTRSISNKYMITLRNQFDVLQEISRALTLNDEYKNFVNGHMEAAAAECIPTKLRAKHSSMGDISI